MLVASVSPLTLTMNTPLSPINTELETIEQRIHYYEVVREAAEVTYKQIELINLDGKINKKSFIIRAYLASNIWTYRKANDTYTELISTGDLTLLSDSNLRKELGNYYSELDGLSSYWLSYTDYRDYIRRLIPVEIQRKIRASCDIWEMNQSSVDCNLHLSQNEINKTFSFVLGDDFSKKEDYDKLIRFSTHARKLLLEHNINIEEY